MELQDLVGRTLDKLESLTFTEDQTQALYWKDLNPDGNSELEWSTTYRGMEILIEHTFMGGPSLIIGGIRIKIDPTNLHRLGALRSAIERNQVLTPQDVLQKILD